MLAEEKGALPLWFPSTVQETLGFPDSQPMVLKQQAPGLPGLCLKPWEVRKQAPRCPPGAELP